MKPLALAAGLVIPGAAHWLTGQRAKAALYGGMVLTLVIAGVSLNGSTAMPSRYSGCVTGVKYRRSITHGFFVASVSVATTPRVSRAT